MYFEKMMEQHERKTEHVLSMQGRGLGPADQGAFAEEDFRIDTRWCGFHLAHLAEAFLIPGGRYYHHPEVRQALERGLAWLTAHRRPGGCLDLTSCNFDSAPDTAFAINQVITAWYLLEKDAGEASSWLRDPMRELIEGCCEGVMNGGFHTPNHRWAISACLKHAASICGREDFSRRADSYLGEGLDIDREGEFAERSGGIYNLVNDDQMIRLFLATGDRTYLEAAASNLRMMLSYIDPDGSVFTHHSTRQDNGQKVYPDGYCFLFLMTGYLLEDEALASWGAWCWETAAAHGRLPAFLGWLALVPELEAYGQRRACDLRQAEQVNRLFPLSGIGRYRRGDWSCTVMTGRPNFLYFQHGENTVCLSVYQNVCAERNFIPETLEKTENGFRLTGSADSWYYLPYEGEGPGTSDWWAMDNAHTRKKQIRDRLLTSVEVAFREDGAEIRFRSEGLSGVPVRLEWGFAAGSRLRNEHFLLQAEAGGCMTVCGGNLQAEPGDHGVITLGPAFGRHDVRNRMGGAYPLSRDRFTVFFTDFSPFERSMVLGTVPRF